MSAVLPDRLLTPEEQDAVAWWQGLSLAARTFWLGQVDYWTGESFAALKDAFAMFRKARCESTGIPLRFCSCSCHVLKARIPS